MGNYFIFITKTSCKMYKCVASVLLFAFFAVGGDATGVQVRTCFPENDRDHTKYDDYLTDLLNVQIDVELTAQYSYLRLAHLFQQPHLYYPKFAQFFKEKSLEEMEHAEDFMNYQTSRGVQRSERFNFEAVPTVETCKNIDSLYDGFRCARDLEISVTKALTKLVAKVGKIPYSQARDANAKPVTYNKALRTAQAALVSDGGDLLISLKEATESTDMISGCNALNINYIELAEHISHEYQGLRRDVIGATRTWQFMSANFLVLLTFLLMLLVFCGPSILSEFHD